MLEISQIGDIPFRHLNLREFTYPQDVDVLSKPSGLLADGGVAFASEQYATKIGKRKIKGEIFERRTRSAEATISALQNLIGKPTDIIGVYPVQVPCDIDAIFLQTRGRIDSVKRVYKSGKWVIDIDFTMEGAWSPLNRLIWEYTDEDESGLVVGTTPSSPSIGLLEPYPSWAEYITERRADMLWRWRRQNENTALMYDPDYWDLVVNYTPEGFHEIGLSEAWSSSSSNNTLWVANTLWNHRPLVLWAFRNLTTTYDVTVKVIRAASLGGTESVIVDTTALDALLTAETATGLQLSDTLIIGDVSGKAFVVRSGIVVVHCSSVLSAYKGITPAYVPSNEHVDYRVEFDVASGYEWANLFQWRMYT